MNMLEECGGVRDVDPPRVSADAAFEAAVVDARCRMASESASPSTGSSVVVVRPVVHPDMIDEDSFWHSAIAALRADGVVSKSDRLIAQAAVLRGDTTAREAFEGLVRRLNHHIVLIVDDSAGALSEQLRGALARAHVDMLASVKNLGIATLGASAAHESRQTVTAPPVRMSDISPRGLGHLRLGAGFSVARFSFIARTALPATVDEGLAVELTGNVAARAELDSLEELGLGAWETEAGGAPRFRYLDGVRADALELFRLSWPDEKRAASALISRRALEDGLPGEALEFAIRSEDIDLIEGVILRAYPLTSAAENEILSLLDRIPPRKILRSPILSIIVAVRRTNPRWRGAGVRNFLLAAADSEARRPARANATELLIRVGVRAFAARLLGSARASADHAMRFHADFMAALRDMSIDESLARAVSVIAYEVGICLLYARETDLAQQLFTHLSRYHRAHIDAEGFDPAQAGFALIDTVRGRAKQTSRILVSAGRARRAVQWLDRSAADVAELSHALSAIQRGAGSEVRRVISRLALRADEIEHWDLLLLARIVLAFYDGEPLKARVDFEETVRARLVDTTHPVIRGRVGSMKSILRIGGVPSLEPLAVSRRESSTPLAQILRALAEIAEGEDDKAAGRVGTVAQLCHTPFQRHFLHIASASIAHAKGDEQAFALSVSQLEYLSSTHGLVIGLLALSQEERIALAATLGDHASLWRGLDLVRSARESPNTAQNALATLTRQERAVLTQLVELNDRQRVAEQMYLSPSTVKVHLRSIYRKLGVHTQTDAILTATAAGILQQDGYASGARSSYGTDRP